MVNSKSIIPKAKIALFQVAKFAKHKQNTMLMSVLAVATFSVCVLV